MKYYLLQPEVAGGFGENTVIDRSSGKMVVLKLHYVFDGWLGDVLLTSSPCLIATEDAMRKLQSIGATGVRFDEVEVTTSDLFQELYPNRQLPRFVWLQINGRPGHDDFGVGRQYGVVVSERALEVLKSLGIANAIIKPFDS